MKTETTSLKQIPFTGMRREDWARIGLSVLAMLLASYLLFNITTHGLADYVAVDCRGQIASAMIIRDHGFAAIYNVPLQEEYQKQLYNYSFGALQQPFDVMSMPYLPLFVPPFLLFLLFSLPVSWVVWTLLNALVLLIYLCRLANQAGLTGTPMLLASMMLCLPTFFNILFGQSNVWVLISLGESFVAFRRGRDFLGGVWLAGLLRSYKCSFFCSPVL